jgi:hypothetical protein
MQGLGLLGVPCAQGYTPFATGARIVPFSTDHYLEAFEASPLGDVTVPLLRRQPNQPLEKAMIDCAHVSFSDNSGKFAHKIQPGLVDLFQEAEQLSEPGKGIVALDATQGRWHVSQPRRGFTRFMSSADKRIVACRGREDDLVQLFLGWHGNVASMFQTTCFYGRAQADSYHQIYTQSYVFQVNSLEVAARLFSLNVSDPTDIAHEVVHKLRYSGQYMITELGEFTQDVSYGTKLRIVSQRKVVSNREHKEPVVSVDVRHNRHRHDKGGLWIVFNAYKMGAGLMALSPTNEDVLWNPIKQLASQ